MNTLNRRSLRKKQSQKTDYVNIIDNLPYEVFIFNVIASSPTEASGEGIINENGDISFKVRCKLDLRYIESNGKYAFDYNKSYTELLKILDSKGKSIEFTPSEDIIIRNFLNHKIIFSIK